MYRGFKLKTIKFKEHDYYYNIGKKMYDKDKNLTTAILKDFIFSDNSLDGSKIQKTWFPQVNADVFISHFHTNEHIAIALAGYLNKEFKIQSFIDSCIWGYADDLLKDIDNKFCPTGPNTYSYKKRNYSTSHVHMMLSSALSMMMDKTECLIFLDTPDSIKPYEGIDRTESPWIYFEIGMSQLLRKKEPKRNLLESVRYYSEGGILEKAIKVKYEVDLKHLTEIDADDLKKWLKIDNSTTADEALDSLYKLKPPKRYSDSLND